MKGIPSVLFMPTGKVDARGREERKPIFLDRNDVSRKSLFAGGREENGFDTNARYNAAGDSPENSSGYQIVLDTMTYLRQQESKQSYYELGNFGLTPRSFVPMEVGVGAWSASNLTKRVYENFGDFESGLVRQSQDNSRNASVKVSMDSVNVPIFQWADSVGYSLIELNQALVNSNWDIISAKHQARMKMWQLGIQDILFLGTKSKNMQGLFINTATPVNTSFITAYIKSLNAANFATFVQGLIATYFTSTNSTKLPTHFVIPMADWLGLTTPVPGTTTLRPMISYLEEAFKMVCGPDFKIIGSAYADAVNNNSKRGFNKNVYALYRMDPEAFLMSIPVDFTVTQPGTADNFHFQDTAYAQLTGLGFYKPLENLLFTF